MLVNFHFRNFKAFRDDTDFSLVAGRGTNFSESLRRLPKMRYAKVLPISAIYGGNASGKSTLMAALQALQRAVVDGKLTEIDPFRLDDACAQAPTSFAIDFSRNGMVWHYELSASAQAVCFEELSTVTDKQQTVVFRRTPEQDFEVNEQVFKGQSEQDINFAKVLGASLPAREVLLFQLVHLQVKAMLAFTQPAYDWFRETLCIIGADSRRIGLGIDLYAARDAYSHALAQADTGIENLDFMPVAPAEVCPAAFLAQFTESGDSISAIPGRNDTILVRTPAGEINALRCISKHSKGDGSVTEFPFSMESDGTRRFLHLLPILLDCSRERVYVVDELDRSLHTNLTTSLLRQVRALVASRQHNMHVIFTTHDAMLMNPKILRKDEIRVATRMEDHSSVLTSLVEFKELTNDHNFRNSYLAGRMGGIPHPQSLI